MCGRIKSNIKNCVYKIYVKIFPMHSLGIIVNFSEIKAVTKTYSVLNMLCSLFLKNDRQKKNCTISEIPK